MFILIIIKKIIIRQWLYSIYIVIVSLLFFYFLLFYFFIIIIFYFFSLIIICIYSHCFYSVQKYDTQQCKSQLAGKNATAVDASDLCRDLSRLQTFFCHVLVRRLATLQVWPQQIIIHFLVCCQQGGPKKSGLQK